MSRTDKPASVDDRRPARRRLRRRLALGPDRRRLPAQSVPELLHPRRAGGRRALSASGRSIRLNADISWVENFRTGGHRVSSAQPRLLAPMAAMLRDKTGGKLSLSASSMRSLLDGIQSRLDESREISRYLTSLLIFLGLLGTFWGLLGTIDSVAAAITGMKVGTGGDPASMFESLKQSLEGPLAGMGIAFSASLFGLSGSLLLGYLDLRAGQAQARFFNELEDWLSGQTRISSGGGA